MVPKSNAAEAKSLSGGLRTRHGPFVSAQFQGARNPGKGPARGPAKMWFRERLRPNCAGPHQKDPAQGAFMIAAAAIWVRIGHPNWAVERTRRQTPPLRARRNSADEQAMPLSLPRNSPESLESREALR